MNRKANDDVFRRRSSMVDGDGLFSDLAQVVCKMQMPKSSLSGWPDDEGRSLGNSRSLRIMFDMGFYTFADSFESGSETDDHGYGYVSEPGFNPNAVSVGCNTLKFCK